MAEATGDCIATDSSRFITVSLRIPLACYLRLGIVECSPLGTLLTGAAELLLLPSSTAMTGAERLCVLPATECI